MYRSLLGAVSYGQWFMAAHSVQQAASEGARPVLAGFNAEDRDAIVGDLVETGAADVEARTVQTVGAQDAVEGSARSLAEHVELDVRTLDLSVNPGDYASIVGNAIGGVAPSLNVLLNQLSGLPGIKLGAADVKVDRLRCGRPTIVA